MTSFLSAQSAAPHDPVPMLVWADHLEERGDLAGAEALRGLAAAGYASLASLASAAAADTAFDDFVLDYRRVPLRDGTGCGCGDMLGRRGNCGYGVADGLDDIGQVGGRGEGLVGIDSVECPAWTPVSQTRRSVFRPWWGQPAAPRRPPPRPR